MAISVLLEITEENIRAIYGWFTCAVISSNTESQCSKQTFSNQYW